MHFLLGNKVELVHFKRVRNALVARGGCQRCTSRRVLVDQGERSMSLFLVRGIEL